MDIQERQACKAAGDHAQGLSIEDEDVEGSCFLSPPSLSKRQGECDRVTSERRALPEETEICWTCDSIPTEDFKSVCGGAEEGAAATAPLLPVDVNLGAERDLQCERW
jgi:hypothetical protein